MPKNSKKTVASKKRIPAVLKPFVALRTKTRTFMARRPHRSFRMTRRRDYARSLHLPGYFAFTKHVNGTIWTHRRHFALLAAVYAALTLILVGIGSQETYSALTSSLQDASSEVLQGDTGQLGNVVLQFASVGSGLTAAPTEGQQTYVVILALLVWLTSVWLLRNLLAGHAVKLRDGLYNAGAPIVATALVLLAFVVQLIPVGIAILGYQAASSTGLLDSGIAAMLFWIAAGLLVVMSLYWLTSTFFALIIVTLPGMYPWRALKTAGDMLVGRRLRILLRMVWMFLVLTVAALVIMLPLILLATWLTSIWPFLTNVPIVPFVLMLFTVCSFVWSACYVYLLYRKVIDDDATPA